MEMTVTQRLILANQYELMALLDSENAAKYHRLQMIVKGGFQKELKELDKDFSDLSEAECNAVRDTLELFNALEISYNNLADKSAISANRIKFVGYCAIKEKKYLQYLRFITQTEAKYSTLMDCPHGCDAQVPMWDKYARMLQTWRKCPHEYHLSAAEIQNILNA